jgi:hypothetical protein
VESFQVFKGWRCVAPLHGDGAPGSSGSSGSCTSFFWFSLVGDAGTDAGFVEVSDIRSPRSTIPLEDDEVESGVYFLRSSLVGDVGADRLSVEVRVLSNAKQENR